MALNNFTAQIETLPKTIIGPGLTTAIVADSFSGTRSTLSITSPLTNVKWAEMIPVTTNSIATAQTSPDNFLLNNSVGSNGLVTMQAASTNNYDTFAPNQLVFSRTGTNNQDVLVLIIGKG